VYGLGMFIGPVLAGMVIERFSANGSGGNDVIPGYTAVFYMAMIIAVIGFVLVLLSGVIHRRTAKSKADSWTA
ncbi:MAG: hypothetical protein IKE81_01810, partial [Clostridia bacterium]|nr:hypothetical protein [Clostridia bacterium]